MGRIAAITVWGQANRINYDDRMRIFVSWSGKASHEMAVLVREWLHRVLQYSQPFVSSQDITKGAQWLVTISDELAGTVEGIVCVTPSNVTAPWLNYEAGALAKTTGQTSVRTLLLGVKPSDLPSGVPLTSFQHTDSLDKDEMWRLVESIHEKAPAGESTSTTIKWAFDMAWPDLEAKLQRIDTKAEAAPTEVDTRDEKTLIQELLGEVRELSLAVAALSEGSRNSTAATRGNPWPTKTGTNDASLVSSIRPGVDIEHPSFGAGRVLQTDGSGDKKVAIVEFPLGQKRLLLRYAPIKLLADDDVPF